MGVISVPVRSPPDQPERCPVDSVFGRPPSTGGDDGSAEGVTAGCGEWPSPVTAGQGDTPASADPSGSEAFSSGGVVVGQARDVQTRSDTDWFTKTERVVLAFRVQGFDASGNLALLVPVEMRGSTFEGSVRDGDRVRVTGRRRRGIIHAKKIENLDDGSEITARGLPAAAKVLTAVGLVAVAAFIAWVFYQVITRS